MSDRTSHLLPARHQQQELFLCDLGDVVLKDDMASMEHPIFSLSKIPDTKPRQYVNGDTELEVVPGAYGCATIWDKDILIFAISQLMAAKKQGRALSPYLEFNAKDFLVFSNRATGGVNYDRLRDGLRRLDGTRLNTTIKTAGEETFVAFGLVEQVKIKRKTSDGRVLQWGLKLSDWLFRAIEANEVLTLHNDYFRLKSSLERRVYEIARKHCGQQQSWKINLDNLQKKAGSSAPKRNFRGSIRKMADAGTIPDYWLELQDDMVTFHNANGRGERQHYARPTPNMISGQTWETVGEILRAENGPDKYALFEQFSTKVEREGLPNDLDAAFAGYCRKATRRST